MISKSQQSMAILDEDKKCTQNMNEMPKKNSSLDKINCDKSTSPSPLTEDNKKCLNNLSENSKSKNVFESIEMKSNEFPCGTRIQLSFSVDRLLSDKLQKNKKPAHPAQRTETHVHDDRGSAKCCDELNASYSCCSLPNCLVNSTSSSLSCKGNSLQVTDEEMSTAPAFNFLDLKTVVRPTPVRAVGNTSESVSPLAHFSSLPPTALIRFHQAHMQHQKQLTQHLPAQQNFTLSPIISPLCGLKPLQMSMQHMGGLHNFSTASTNRIPTKINFDIPVVRPNLAGISTLRNHQLAGASPSDVHFNHNNTVSSSPANTPTTGGNSGNSHGSVISGKRKRSWSRAVFSNLQRKGLEIQFQQQKYITKPDRRKLAARLNLTDAQVKVWFQNRRMKWRHTRENLKSGQEKQPSETASTDSLKATAAIDGADNDLPGYSSDGSSSLEISDGEEDDDEIDVVE